MRLLEADTPLRFLIDVAGVTAIDVAERLKVQPSIISMAKTGQRKLTPKQNKELKAYINEVLDELEETDLKGKHHDLIVAVIEYGDSLL